MRLFLLIACHIVASEAGLNVHEKMYTKLDAVSPCIVRLNGSQSFGCTSSRNGNVGVIHIAQNASDLDWVLNSAQMDAYVVGLPLIMFTFENLQKLNSSDHIKGVLLMHKSGEKVSLFSPEDTCPNRYSGLAGPRTMKTMCDDRDPWNPYTVFSSISMYKWQMPIFFSDHEETINQVNDCFRKFNFPLNTQLDRALCALEMSAHMYASVDSTTCIRRSGMMYNVRPVRYCDPLGDHNIYAPVVPLDQYKKKDYIVVAARLDSTSLFYGMAPGSLSTATSLVTLLLTAELLFQLKQNVDPESVKKNVLFVLFNGEAYDYIGSSRVAYDMERGQFPFKETPINKDDISLFVELSQLNNDKTVTYHTYKTADQNVTSFMNTFKNVSERYNFNVDLKPSQSDYIPPSSIQSFLVMKENMSGFIFSSYEKKFKNKFYHSVFDDQVNLGYKYAKNDPIDTDSLQAFVANFSTALAHSLFSEMTEEKPGENKTVNSQLADELLHCYIDTMDCEFLTKAGFDMSSVQKSKLDYYVGVTLVGNQMTMLTKFVFVHLTGKNITATSREECFSKAKMTQFTYYWIGETFECFESTVNISDALSPAFLIPEYDLAEGVYSSWTESSWQSISVRMFLKPSPKYEWLAFIIGTVVIIVSFLTLYWVKYNARELFNYPHLITAANL